MDALSFYHSISQYRKKAKQSTTPPVFSRDFAYSNNAPVVLPDPTRMEEGNISRASAKTFAELLSGPIVDIYVGSERRHWTLHKNLLCHHSSYFETEFQGHEVPKKDSSTTLELPDLNPRGFELLVKWLYQGHLENVSNLDDEGKYEYAVACHKLYQLCDKFDIVHLKNLAIDQYRENLHAAQLVPDPDEINEIYRASPPNSPFRRLMAKIAARQIMDPDVDKDADSYRLCFEDNAEFAIEMVNAIRQLSGGMLFNDPTAEGDKCEWHDHRDGSACSEKGKRSQGPAKILSPATQRAKPSTPRKLGAASHQAQAKTERPPTRPSPHPRNAGSATPASERNTVAGVRKRPRKLARLPASSVSGVSDSAPSLANESRKVTSKAGSSPDRTFDDSTFDQRSTANTPRKLTTPSRTSKSSNVGSVPRRVNYVNGIVRQLNGLDVSIGATASTESRSQKTPAKAALRA